MPGLIAANPESGPYSLRPGSIRYCEQKKPALKSTGVKLKNRAKSPVAMSDDFLAVVLSGRNTPQITTVTSRNIANFQSIDKPTLLLSQNASCGAICWRIVGTARLRKFVSTPISRTLVSLPLISRTTVSPSTIRTT